MLRRQGQLDFLIEHYSSRPIHKVDAEVAIAIRMAIYQIRFLDRIPPYAAVNDSLNLLRGARKLSSIGFANAVLRKVTSKDVPIPEERAAPAWLLEKVDARFRRGGRPGDRARESPGSQAVSACSGGSRTAAWVRERRTCPAAGKWRRRTRDYRVQDIGSQAIVPLLQIALRPDASWTCARRPGTRRRRRWNARDRGDGDRSFVSAAQGSETAGRGAGGGWTPPCRCRFWVCSTAILVDAPCSGTGTLAHNPEIKWRLMADELPRFAERQRRILTNALACLAPGGRLVYSTCSLEPEENEQVARAVAGARIEREVRRMPGRDPGDGFYAAVIR